MERQVILWFVSPRALSATQVFLRAKTKEEYLSYIARLILHVRQQSSGQQVLQLHIMEDKDIDGDGLDGDGLDVEDSPSVLLQGGGGDLDLGGMQPMQHQQQMQQQMQQQVNCLCGSTWWWEQQMCGGSIRCVVVATVVWW